MTGLTSERVACVFVCLGSCWFAGCGGGDSDGRDPEGLGGGAQQGTGGTAAGTGGSSDGVGGSGEGTGGAPVTVCSGPVIDLDDLEGTGGGATVISEDEDWGVVRGMEGRGDDLYVLATDGLYVVEGDSPDGRMITDQVPELASSYLDASRGRLRVNSTHAYFATSEGISRISLSDGSVETLFVEPVENRIVYSLQLSGDKLYFGVSGDYVYSLPLEGGEEPNLVTEQIPNSSFWVDGDFIYGPGQYSRISRVPLAGGELEVITSHAQDDLSPFVNQVEVRDGKIYWNDGGAFLSCAIDDCLEPDRHSGYHSDLFIVVGDRFYGTSGSLGWGSLVENKCGLLVGRGESTEVRTFGVTNDYVFFVGGFGGSVVRLPIE